MSLIKLRPEARGPFLALVAALARLEEDGRTTPCRVDPEPFVSDDRKERTEAAAACALCPVRRQCSVYAETQQECWHTWAGIDRTPRLRKATR